MTKPNVWYRKLKTHKNALQATFSGVWRGEVRTQHLQLSMPLSNSTEEHPQVPVHALCEADTETEEQGHLPVCPATLLTSSSKLCTPSARLKQLTGFASGPCTNIYSATDVPVA